MSQVATVTETSIKVGPLPGGGYRIAGALSLHKYHNAASARAAAREVQFINDDNRAEPLVNAVRFGRAPKSLTR
jgi:hypothetical protein